MAKSRAYGADVAFLLGFESTYGTRPDGSGEGVYRKLPVVSIGLDSERPLGTAPLLGKGRNALDPYYEAVTVAGDIVVPADLRDLGWWLKAVFGAPVTTGASAPYTHVFKSGGALPSFAVEVGHTALTTPEFVVFEGAKAGGLSLDMARTGPVNVTIPVTAQARSEESATEDAGPLEQVLSRFNNGSGSISVGGSQLANVTGGRLEFSNVLEAIETIRADGKIDGVDETEATCSGSVDVRFSTDTTLRDAVAAEAPVALKYEFTIPSTSYVLRFEMPRVFLPKPRGEISGPGGIQAGYNWQAAYDASAGYLLRVTLINDVASYA